MPNKRRRGENSWLLTAELGYDAKGNRIRKTKTIRVKDPALLRAPKRLEEYLNTELTKFQISVETGVYITPGKMSFASFIEEWKKNFVLVELEEKTIDSYLFHTNARISPHFGHMQMDNINTMHILAFMDSLRKPHARLDGKGPLKSASLVYNYRVLKSIFSKAEEWKVITDNPMVGVKKPKEDDIKQMEVYNEEEIKLLFDALEYESAQIRALITLAFTTGMRRAEIAGLEWSRINFEAKHLYIDDTIPKFKDGEPLRKPPKNKKSRRIALSETLITELQALQELRADELSELDDQWEGGKYSYVFCHPDGKPYSPGWFTKKWIDFHRRYNLKPIRLHDLRHTSASWMIYKKIHSEAIAKRLGHSNIKMLEIYGHIFESVDQAAASVFDDI
ncbi:integrase [Paenibacillus cellulosilyticus]|uniref:Integrase n=1 Tax=Paenibacillus cellulosilyticus TaxID=375489 RepID=A0A2V2Z108_9BACL|nr:site-specific integrase [Paenibacillus cellulosilyticus]PWW06279.1 integrase [Paenibacillus cellulosilyticus]QKS42970.1 site-specific integrase [Paenibacillus cellulosilyticus]QKS43438.1 site-specific integrase [Paenibacillus cellulosilyticus]